MFYRGGYHFKIITVPAPVDFPSTRMRQVLSLDAGHLNGEWSGGAVLTPNGKYSNNKIGVLIVSHIAICDKETSLNCKFLLLQSKENAPFGAYYTEGR